jgi:fumarylacetoacetase
MNKSDSIRANDPGLKSWVSIPENSDFPIQNLPFGIFRHDGHEPRVGVAIGDFVLDLYMLNLHGYLDAFDLPASVLQTDSLNDLIAAGKVKTKELRNRISDLLKEGNDELASIPDVYGKFIYPVSQVTMLLPVHPGDYTDFYSSEVHATNVGKMFRPDNPLLPNWKHIPVGYHGRSSSIVVSGTPFHRPKGQLMPPDAKAPVFGPTQRMDFELEMAFITFDGKPLGHPITVQEADKYIFGMVIFNDWSARDIQKWEYVPLGPFLAKNFASSVSPWVVTLDALEPFRTANQPQDPEVLEYLRSPEARNIDINLEVYLQPEGGNDQRICRSNYRHLYWNMNQQLAHQTVNGCNVRAGDIYASGTISAPADDGYGSMLELTWGGQNPLDLPEGGTRKFIEDGDTISMRAWSEKDGVRVGFGEVRSKVLPTL